MQNDMRDRLAELLQEYTDNNNGGGSNHGRADHLITNNVVPVVRCANCIHRKKGVFRAVDNLVFWQCEKHDIEILLTDFCSYGEREKEIDNYGTNDTKP